MTEFPEGLEIIDEHGNLNDLAHTLMDLYILLYQEIEQSNRGTIFKLGAPTGLTLEDMEDVPFPSEKLQIRYEELTDKLLSIRKQLKHQGYKESSTPEIDGTLLN